MTTQNNIEEQKRVMPVVAVIFDDEGRFLLSRRYFPEKPRIHDKWQFAGGGIEFGEHPIDTLNREIKEELGITIELVSTQPVITSHVYKEDNVHTIVIAYPAKHSEGIIDNSGDEESSEVKWFRYEEIDFANSLPKTKEIIDETRKRFIIENNEN